MFKDGAYFCYFVYSDTFCACRDGPRGSNFLTRIINSRIFLCGFDYAGNGDLSEGLEIPKGQFGRGRGGGGGGVSTHFSEIFNLQFGKYSIHCYRF